MLVLLVLGEYKPYSPGPSLAFRGALVLWRQLQALAVADLLGGLPIRHAAGVDIKEGVGAAVTVVVVLEHRIVEGEGIA